MGNNFFSGVELPSEQILASCIHCGMCLQACPTYNITFDELSSPRGRIRLIKSVAEGQLEITKKFVEEMNFCLDCQACETACPAGVKYGHLVEAARVQIENSSFTGFFPKFLKRIVFRKILTNFTLLKFLAKLIRIYQKSFLRKFLIKSHLLRKISNKLYEIDSLAPKISNYFTDEIFEEIISAKKEKQYTVLFPVGCLMNVMFSEENKDTVELLSKLGCEVIIPKEQTCCGSLAAHNGDIESGREQARKTINLFEKYNFDFIVSNSAGCGAFMKEYEYILKDDPEYAEKAKMFSSKVKDIMEFICENFHLDGITSDNINVTYHEACHLVHTQKISEEPKRVLSQIKGVNLVTLSEATMCCGSAGIYNIVNFDYSMILLKRKMENIKSTQSKIVLAGNPGCLGQIRYGAKKFNVDVEVLHPVSLLNKIIQ